MGWNHQNCIVSLFALSMSWREPTVITCDHNANHLYGACVYCGLLERGTREQFDGGVEDRVERFGFVLLSIAT
jgi:hypothetical protein